MSEDSLTAKIVGALLGLAVAIGRIDILEDAGFDVALTLASAEEEASDETE